MRPPLPHNPMFSTERNEPARVFPNLESESLEGAHPVHPIICGVSPAGVAQRTTNVWVEVRVKGLEPPRAPRTGNANVPASCAC